MIRPPISHVFLKVWQSDKTDRHAEWQTRPSMDMSVRGVYTFWVCLTYMTYPEITLFFFYFMLPWPTSAGKLTVENLSFTSTFFQTDILKQNSNVFFFKFDSFIFIHSFNLVRKPIYNAWEALVPSPNLLLSKGNMWSAIPFVLLCMFVIVSDG